MTNKLDSISKALEKRFGEPVIMKMSDSKNTDIKTFSSGRPDLDAALGGGYAIGKIIEIYAEMAVGKTGLALEAIASIQANGGTAALIDAENALNKGYCKQIGVEVDDLYICQPTYGEQAFETVRALIKSEEIDLIVVDSVAALIPLAELEGESGEAKIGLQARMMSQGVKMIVGDATRYNCTVIFINQLRSTIAMYGPSTTTTGGKALGFYASQRLEVKSKGNILENKKVIGFKQNVKITKNKVIPPFKEITNDIIYGIGIDKTVGLIDALYEKGILTKAGPMIRYKGENLAKGAKALRGLIDDNPEFLEELKNELNK